MSVNTIVEKIHGGKQGPEIMPMELVHVSKVNLGAWARQLRDWGFTDVPERFLALTDPAK